MINRLNLLRRRILVRKDDFVAFYKSWINEIFLRFNREKTKHRILIYHINGLSYGGTEKGLQFIAKNLNKEKYDVFYMYGEKPELFGNIKKEDLIPKRKELLEAGVSLIRIDFDRQNGPPGHIVKRINPSPRKVVKSLDIDLFVTAGMGHGSYPIPILKCPIILIAVFGYGRTLYKKVKYILPISDAVSCAISDIIPQRKIIPLPLPVQRPPLNIKELGMKFREKYNISQQTLVFGRIGRSDDDIFDPIAIDAFEKVIKESKKDCIYLIVGPCEKLKEIVNNRKIPHIVFVDALSSENEVWSFHGAIDVLAHYRLDGETQGVNIVESMAAGNPIISHKSRYWNAHLEYLTKDFSFVADIDSVDQYASFMKFFLESENNDSIKKMRQYSKAVYEQKFSPEMYLNKLDAIMMKALSKTR